QDSNGNEHLETEPECFRKLFIGGISPTTTEEMMRDFYGKFGELTDCVVMRDPVTKKARGFGFVTYSTKSMVDECMINRPHEIDGKKVDPKRAVPRDNNSKGESNVSSKRLYVSGIKDDHTEAMLSDFFSKFGTVEKVDIVSDKATGKIRGFAFVNFDDHDAVDQCILLKSHQVNGYRCDVKKGLTKDEMAKAQQSERERLERANRSRGMGRGGPGGAPGGGGGGQWSGQGWGGPQAGGGGGYGGQQGGGYGGGQGGYGGGGGYGAPAAAQGGWGGQQGGGGGYGGGQGGYGGGGGYGGQHGGYGAPAPAQGGGQGWGAGAQGGGYGASYGAPPSRGY
ncbi:hypothetical protein PENTCL1PPCAC_26293, partial [Pristionchus entomophagus]